MPVRKDPLIPGYFYHIYNRGINSETVFRNDRNYLFFLRRIKQIISPTTASIVAYVLMPTHYHFLIWINTIDFSKSMGRLILSYTKACNREWGRTGPLFEGRFKAKCVESDEYILGLSRYIHLNPVSAHLVGEPSEWPYSNYVDFISRENDKHPSTNIILRYFDNLNPKIAYRQFVEECIEEYDQNFQQLLYD